MFFARVCKRAHSCPKETENIGIVERGRGSFIFIFIKPLNNYKYICTYIRVCPRACVCFKTHHRTGLNLQEKLSFQNKSGSDRFLSYFLRAGNIFKRYPLFPWYDNREIFLSKADEILTNPTSQRKTISQKAQRKGGIFPLQRCWCAMPQGAGQHCNAHTPSPASPLLSPLCLSSFCKWMATAISWKVSDRGSGKGAGVY